MGKTAALEHSMSMINFQSPGGGLGGGAGGGAGGGGASGGASGGVFGPNGLFGGLMGPGAGGGPPPAASVGTGGSSGHGAGMGLRPIPEVPAGGRAGGFSRSLSVPSMPTTRRPSSMMLSEYMSSLAEEKRGEQAEEEDPEGVWF